MDVATFLRREGGVARRTSIVAACGRRALEDALLRGVVSRAAQGTYVLAAAQDRVAAVALRGALSRESAAGHWDLGLLQPPARPHVTVPRHRRRSPAADHGVALHYGDLDPAELAAGVTSLDRTVLDCARHCDWPQALAVADTALRLGYLTRVALDDLAAALSGPGSVRAGAVLRAADARAESPMESALRGILLAAGVEGFVPQVRVPGLARVDLGHPGLGIALEADSFAWHGQRARLARDARRYTDLVAHGWTVLRFAWEHVVGDPGWVVGTVRRTVELRSRAAA